MNQKIAVLYQFSQPLAKNGVVKPFKAGYYRLYKFITMFNVTH